MVHKRVVETVLHRRGEFVQVLLVQRQGGNHFLVQHLVHESPHRVVVHAVPHDVESRQVGAQYKSGVRAVQDPHLPLLVGGHVRHHDHGHAGLFERQAVLQAVRPFDHPDAEHFAHVCQRVFISVGFRQCGDFLRIPDPSGHNPVHQRGAEDILLVHPAHKRFVQLPVRRVLVHALQQLLAVVVDQLAAQHGHAGHSGGVPFIQHAGQLRGEADRRFLVEPALAFVHDARLGGIAHDDFQVGAPGKLQHLVPVSVGIHAPAHAADHALVVHLAAVLAAPQVQGIQPLLLVDQVRQALRDRLHKHHLAVEPGFFVGNVDKVVHKCPQEVAFPELHHFLRCAFQDVPLVSGFLQYLVIQLCHSDLPRFHVNN